MKIIDSHHHLWRYRTDEFPWITPDMAPLRRDFLTPDLAQVCEDHGITATVVVQARQTLEETAWLLSIAKSSPYISGVVGWVPLHSPDLSVILSELTAPTEQDRSQRSLLVGVRHVIHDEADERFINREDINKGVAELHRFNLTYDILIFPRHLPLTVPFVDRHEHQIFVVDHCAKPRIREGEIAEWERYMRELAARPQVYCKLSGLLTEAGPRWNAEDLTRYMDVVLDAFGPQRVMFGSDWPVCLGSGSYSDWLHIVTEYCSALSPDEQARLFAGTAAEAYRLELST